MRALVLTACVLACPVYAVQWVDGGFVTTDATGEYSDYTRYDAYTPQGTPIPVDWNAETPVVPSGDELQPSFSGPGGAELKISSRATVTDANWSGGTFNAQITVEAALVRAGKRYLVALPSTPREVTPYWSPDGRRLLLLMRSDESASYFGVVVPGPYPRVQVLYPPKAPLPAADLVRVDQLAAKVGCVVSFAGEAQKARPNSVIYAAKGSEAEGKALAALIPGGATVEPLTWKTSANLVFAVGASFK